jgi:hypothetical protein
MPWHDHDVYTRVRSQVGGTYLPAKEISWGAVMGAAGEIDYMSILNSLRGNVTSGTPAATPSGKPAAAATRLF